MIFGESKPDKIPGHSCFLFTGSAWFDQFFIGHFTTDLHIFLSHFVATYVNALFYQALFDRFTLFLVAFCCKINLRILLKSLPGVFFSLSAIIFSFLEPKCEYHLSTYRMILGTWMVAAPERATTHLGVKQVTDVKWPCPCKLLKKTLSLFAVILSIGKIQIKNLFIIFTSSIQRGQEKDKRKSQKQWWEF